MATLSSLRSRRSEAQLHALADVEREIRTVDSSARRKYLREFNRAFQSYTSVLNAEEVTRAVSAADVVLIGDYHALPASQRYAACLLEQSAHAGDRTVVLGVETIFSRDQHILDEWWRREIDEAELRQRIRFDLDWGYDWPPFYELLVTAREHAEAIYGLDCMPREDLRKIGARDRHAVHKIAEIRQRHPGAAILVLFGESHLAPTHLPKLLREHMPSERVLTLLQNVDTLYWKAAGEQHERVEAVRMTENAICVFNSTPLEKYENYRLHLSRWGRAEEDGPDLAPTIYNLIDSLLRFLNIKLYSSHNGAQPKFLVDLLPEVYCGSEARLRRVLESEGLNETGLEDLLGKIEERGGAYLPRANVFYLREFQMMYAAEEAARFLHRACRGLLSQAAGNLSAQPEDLFYVRAVEHALAYLGSRILYPARAEENMECELSRAACEDLVRDSIRLDSRLWEKAAREFGYALGCNLYHSYLSGTVSRNRLRRSFLTHLDEPGVARKLCFELLRKRRLARKGPQPDHTVQDRSLQNSSA